MSTLNVYNATRITTRLHDNGKHAWRTFEIEDADGTVIEVCAFADDGDIEQIRIRDEDEPRQRTNPETLMSGRVDEGPDVPATTCPKCDGPAFIDRDADEIVCENGCPLRGGAFGVTANGQVAELDDDTPAFCRPQAE